MIQWLPATSVLVATLLVAQPVAQNEIFAPASNVSFTISTVRNDYSTREPVPVKYRIAIIGNAALYVPRGFEATACVEHGSPHVWGSFENSEGKKFLPGYGVSCGSTPGAVRLTVTERMSKAAVLLRPGEYLDATLQLQPEMFGLPAGAYRIQVTLTGWNDDKFTDAERMALARMGNPFLRGEIPASTQINLVAAPQ